MILYASFDPVNGYKLVRKESYQECEPASSRTAGEQVNPSRSVGDYILDPQKMEVIQGASGPLKYKPSRPDPSDETKPSIDGDEKSLKSLSMVSYNRCAPECCIDSPYSCDRGCICLTDKQYDYLGGRGNNHRPISCTFDGL
jgi:hypothetical protein